MSWITKILKGLLNIADEPDAKEDKVVKGMPDLMQALYADMREAENSVTLSMANVGQKRLRLKSLLNTLDQKKAETNALLEKDEQLAQAYYHSDVLPLENEVERLMGQIETLDAQTAEELERFRDFEHKATEAKDKLREAEQIERFARITERMAETSKSYENSSGALAKIDAHIEQVEFRAAQATAKLALRNHGEIKVDPKAREARALIAESKNSGKFLEFKAEMKAITDGGAVDSTSDKAKKLLAAPAFGGALRK